MTNDYAWYVIISSIISWWNIFTKLRVEIIWIESILIPLNLGSRVYA